MIEALREIVTIIKDLPAYAVWILAGFLFYKLTIIGSVYGVIRLGINRLFDYLGKDRKVITEFKIGDITIDTSTHHALILLFEMIKKPGATYLHHDNVNFAIQAVKEKREREGKG